MNVDGKVGIRDRVCTTGHKLLDVLDEFVDIEEAMCHNQNLTAIPVKARELLTREGLVLAEDIITRRLPELRDFYPSGLSVDFKHIEIYRKIKRILH